MKIRHGKDLRKGRYSECGRPYLITTVILERRPVFEDFILANCLIRELRDADDSQLVDTVAWVIMPDHLHWLFSLRADSLSAVVKRVKSRSGMSINRQLGRSGPLWQKGFHDHALRRNEDVEIAARYIIANPLRAGLVKDICDYPFWHAAWTDRRADIEF